jgi:ABC-type lipoprotein export system ATPase subunit
VPSAFNGKKPSFDGRRSSGASGANRSVAEVERIELEWRALSCCYRTPTGNKWVLKDIYGAANPGEMQVGCRRGLWGWSNMPRGRLRLPGRSLDGDVPTCSTPCHAKPAGGPMLMAFVPHRCHQLVVTQALLGPSGAGKSTLMDMLAQRKSTGQLSGTVLVDGLPAESSFIRSTAYVPQNDNFVPVMTTLEVMQFYAGIILPRDWTTARRAARVNEVLTDMGLAHAHKTLVGGQSPGGLMHRGLSGGERKRLSIATGILAAPSVVFLDEPTTGLDSFAALTVRQGCCQAMQPRRPAVGSAKRAKNGGVPSCRRQLCGYAGKLLHGARPSSLACSVMQHRAGSTQQPHVPALQKCSCTAPSRCCVGHGLHEAHGTGQRPHRDRRYPPAALCHLVHV